ncbi:MAG: SH3 domain-containing protein [Cellvibrionaceae bacterium]|nr:SH3 domain-containing protein [Cellvibrionaceae bacterium]
MKGLGLTMQTTIKRSGIMLALLLASGSALAAQYCVVSGNSVKVRGGPGTQYDGISQLNSGHVVSCLRKQGMWTEIRFSNPVLPPGKQERTGWMASRFLKEDQVSSIGERPQRDEPGIYDYQAETNSSGAYSPEPKANSPEPVNSPEPTSSPEPVNSPEPTNSPEPINSPEPANSPEQSPASYPQPYQVSVNSLSLRSGPGTNYRRIAGLSRNHPVSVQGIQGDWASVQTPNPNYPATSLNGWVAADFIKPGPQAPTQAPSQSAAAPTQVQAGANGQDKTFQDRLLTPDARPESRRNTMLMLPEGQPVGLKLENHRLACERNSSEQVQGCDLTMWFKLRGQPDVSRARVRCEADLMVGVKTGDPIRYPLNQEQVYKVSTDATSNKMSTRLEATGGQYDVRTVDVLSHRCAVVAYGRKKGN